MTIKDVQTRFHEHLKGLFGKNEINSFFFLLSESYLNKSRLQIALEPNFMLEEKHLELFLKALDQLKLEYPIQYILNEVEFMGLRLRVNENVLIPRPETEELIRWIFDDYPKANIKSVLDIGTGSGCIPIALAKHYSETKVYAIDISADALRIAKENAKINEVHIFFDTSDILKVEKLDHHFDVIVSNPPYVREREKTEMKKNVLQYEPHLALFVSDHDPLIFYKKIATLAFLSLHTNGALYFEINQYLGVSLCTMLRSIGFKKVELKKDMFGNDRMIKAIKN